MFEAFDFISSFLSTNLFFFFCIPLLSYLCYCLFEFLANYFLYLDLRFPSSDSSLDFLPVDDDIDFPPS